MPKKPDPKNPVIDLSDDVRQRIGIDLITKIRNSRDGMQGILKSMKAWDDLFEGKLPPKDFPWENCSNVNVPLVQWVVDTMIPNITAVILGIEPILLVKPPRGRLDKKEMAIRIQQWLETMSVDVMDLPEAYEEVISDALRYGTGIAKEPWREEYRMVRDIVENDPLALDNAAVGQEISYPERKYFGPKIESVDLRNFVVYPLTAKSPEDAYLIGDRFRLSKNQVDDRFKSGVFYAGVKESLRAPDNETGGVADYNDTVLDEYEGIEKVDYEQYRFWEVIAPYDADKDGTPEDCVFTIEEDSGIVVRAVKFPYLHGRRYYHRACVAPRSRRFFGRSIIGILEQPQHALNSFFNLWMDAHTIAMTKSWKQLRGSETDPDDIEFKPNGVIPVGSMDELEELKVSPAIPGVDVLSVLRDFSERSVPVNNNTLGKEASDSDATAREVSIVAAKGSVRFEDIIRRLSRPLVEIGEQALLLCAEFMTDEDIAELMDGSENESAPITRRDLMQSWRLRPHGNVGTADKSQQRQEAIFLYKSLQQNPLVMQNPMRVYRLTQDLLTAFDRDDVESYIGTEDELRQLMQGQEQKHIQELATVMGKMLNIPPEIIMRAYTQASQVLKGGQNGAKPGVGGPAQSVGGNGQPVAISPGANR